MANRRFEQNQYAMEKKTVNLFAKVTFGATGAPTLNTTLTIGGLTRTISKGISSVVRNSAGTYTFTFGAPAGANQAAQVDNYYFLLGFGANYVDSASPASPIVHVVADNSSSGSVQIQFTNTSSVATDPASGEVCLFNFTLSNSSI